MASRLFWLFYGPRLLRIFKKADVQGHDYVPGFLESVPDKVLRTFHTAFELSYWASPILGAVLYRRGYFTQEGWLSLVRLMLSLTVVYTTAYFVRGLGRMGNAEYRTFINTVVEARSTGSLQSKKDLAAYDMEFWAWPVDFRWDEGNNMEKKREKKAAPSTRRSQAIERSSIPCRFLSYLAMHTFGRRMVYPGATSLMNYVLSSMLRTGRANLVEEEHGQRAKLLTEDGNEIDTIFMNRRGKHSNGETLIIAFEGNAGFYELGCIGVPLELKFSVLGWNHPGFGGSTGVPYPDQEQHAIDTVIQYAIQRLGFQPENIGLFAWSIGGYTASWAARTYPDLQFVVLDATFDDIVPLAIAKMPQSWKNLVALSLRTYMDLNVGEQLLDYHGPVLLIRRTRDEIITTEQSHDMSEVLSSNRGNFLLLKLLQHRYPTIVDESTLPTMKDFLALEPFRQAASLLEAGVVAEECNSFLSQQVKEDESHFPLSIDVKGDANLKTKLALFLITVHMENFESTHCAQLQPASLLHKPWVPGSHL